MFANRVVQQSMRRLTLQPSSRVVLSKFAGPAAVATNTHYLQRRPAATQQISDAEAASQILAKQRINRPVAPHLSIYKPQITWYASALNRITGCIVSGGFYAFGAAYLVAPLLGWHLESASLAAAFGSLPFVAKFLLKLGVALPFTFHSFNGLRHLAWDMGLGFSNKQVQQTGWTVVGISIVSALYLAFV